MLSRTSELRQLATELADRLAGTEHEHAARTTAALVLDLTGEIDAVYIAIERGVSPALRRIAGPFPTPDPPSDGASPAVAG